MKRLAAFVVIAVALLFTGAAEAARTGPAATGDLAWTDCGDGFECAKLAVPRDWDHPRNASRSSLR